MTLLYSHPSHPEKVDRKAGHHVRRLGPHQLVTVRATLDQNGTFDVDAIDQLACDKVIIDLLESERLTWSSLKLRRGQREGIHTLSTRKIVRNCGSGSPAEKSKGSSLPVKMGEALQGPCSNCSSEFRYCEGDHR